MTAFGNLRDTQGIVEISPADFTAAGRRLMGSLWEEGQEAYERRWLGAASPQRARGEIFLLGLPDPGGSGDPAARLALWKPAGGGDSLFFLYARDPALPDAAAEGFVRSVRAFARERGMPSLLGPMAFSTWHPYRFISRMGAAPFFPGEQRLPERDARDFLAAGFQAVAEYESTWVGDLAGSIRIGLAMGVDRSLGQVEVEVIGQDRLPEMLPRLHALSSAIFADNFGYAPLPLEDFLALSADGGKRGESALILASAGGRPAGFAFSYAIGPYRAGADADAGESGAPAVEACVLKTLGVHPDFRSLGLGYGLSYLTHKHWLERGRGAIIHAYMKTDNRSRSMSAHFGTSLRRYCLVGAGGAGGAGG